MSALIKITLASGRGIWARSFYIEETYAGLLEGTPSRMMNDHLLSSLAPRAGRIFSEGPAHIIDPPRRAVQGVNPFRQSEYFPSFWIASSFTSMPIDNSMTLSGLTLVWFQEEPLPVPAEDALEGIRLIDWDRLARDYDP